MKAMLAVALGLLALGAAPADDFSRAILDAHNRERATLHLPPLAWNDAMAREALTWARYLAASGRFEHSPRSEDEGENLWAGTAGAYTPQEMVGAWIAEKRDYRYGKFPDVAADGDWHKVGHYTQVIWKNTTEIGCGLATGIGPAGSARGDDGSSDGRGMRSGNGSARGLDVLVCRYSPAGNYIGETPY